MKKGMVLLLCLLSCLITVQAAELRLPKDRVGKPVLAGSRIVDVNVSRGKVFAPGQRNLKPLLAVFEPDGAGNLVLRRLDEGRRRGGPRPPENLLFPILSESADTLVLGLEPAFATYPEGLSAIPPRMLAGPAVSYNLVSVKETDQYLQVTGSYAYADGLRVTAACHFIFLSEKPMPARTVEGYSRVEGPRQARLPSLRWNLHGGRKLDFYVDKAFPEGWYPYIKEGIEDWNKAFRAIGLGDIIRVFPESDTLDRNSPLVNMVRYMDVEEANAKGDVLFDLRSGEILQGDILWWKNVKQLLCNWRYVQTGAADPQARLLDYPLEMLGPLIRHAVCHEMGHVLGLNHNMGASWSYPTDSLRDVRFTRRYGTTASVMDYARYNHLATAADVAAGVGLLPPRLGPYDYYAIALGYGREEPVPGPYCYYAPMITAAISPDPSSQAETLGNDLLRSSAAGIGNCRALLELDGLTPERTRLLSQKYYQYVFLSLSNIGGAVAGEPVSRKVCDKTLAFVLASLSHVPPGLFDSEQEKRILHELEGNFLPERVRENGGEKALKHYYRKLKRYKKQYHF